jgi:hypothetical protein
LLKRPPLFLKPNPQSSAYLDNSEF